MNQFNLICFSPAPDSPSPTSQNWERGPPSDSHYTTGWPRRVLYSSILKLLADDLPDHLDILSQGPVFHCAFWSLASMVWMLKPLSWGMGAFWIQPFLPSWRLGCRLLIKATFTPWNAYFAWFKILKLSSYYSIIHLLSFLLFGLDQNWPRGTNLRISHSVLETFGVSCSSGGHCSGRSS